jgi:hypothetical protein
MSPQMGSGELTVYNQVNFKSRAKAGIWRAN